jgi:hypothetical protein
MILPRSGEMRRASMMSVMALLLLSPSADAKEQEEDPFQVTAKLIKIPGTPPPDDLYDYAYVMKYQVLGGKYDKKLLLVAHYKPRRARSAIDDKMKKHVGGTVTRFRENDVHVLRLTAKLKSIWKGALVDEFFAADRTSVRYWCLRADPARSK